MGSYRFHDLGDRGRASLNHQTPAVGSHIKRAMECAQQKSSAGLEDWLWAAPRRGRTVRHGNLANAEQADYRQVTRLAGSPLGDVRAHAARRRRQFTTRAGTLGDARLVGDRSPRSAVFCSSRPVGRGYRRRWSGRDTEPLARRLLSSLCRCLDRRQPSRRQKREDSPCAQCPLLSSLPFCSSVVARRLPNQSTWVAATSRSPFRPATAPTHRHRSSCCCTGTDPAATARTPI